MHMHTHTHNLIMCFVFSSVVSALKVMSSNRRPELRGGSILGGSKGFYMIPSLRPVSIRHVWWLSAIINYHLLCLLPQITFFSLPLTCDTNTGKTAPHCDGPAGENRFPSSLLIAVSFSLMLSSADTGRTTLCLEYECCGPSTSRFLLTVITHAVFLLHDSLEHLQPTASVDDICKAGKHKQACRRCAGSGAVVRKVLPTCSVILCHMLVCWWAWV